MEDLVNNIWNNYGNIECIYFCKTCKKCILNDNFKKTLEDSNFKEIVLEEFKED